ncbi:MAG: acyltransferase [Clostridiaceae bacterium]|nr:acyltransferase [Clostridiaceae bacterium]
MPDNLTEFKAAISNLHFKLRNEINERWDRVLPFNEEFTDRWEKAKYLGFGEGSSIYDGSVVMGSVKIGSHCWIGPFTLLDGSGGLIIGDYCHISAGVQIYSHDTVKWVLSKGKQQYEKNQTLIGSCCHIGSMSVIVKGVQIGNHCVIGANSFVNKDIPDYSIAVGSPARIIGNVTIDDSGNAELVYLKK